MRYESQIVCLRLMIDWFIEDSPILKLIRVLEI